MPLARPRTAPLPVVLVLVLVRMLTLVFRFMQRGPQRLHRFSRDVTLTTPRIASLSHVPSNPAGRAPRCEK